MRDSKQGVLRSIVATTVALVLAIALFVATTSSASAVHPDFTAWGDFFTRLVGAVPLGAFTTDGYASGPFMLMCVLLMNYASDLLSLTETRWAIARMVRTKKTLQTLWIDLTLTGVIWAVGAVFATLAWAFAIGLGDQA